MGNPGPLLALSPPSRPPCCPLDPTKQEAFLAEQFMVGLRKTRATYGGRPRGEFFFDLLGQRLNISHSGCVRTLKPTNIKSRIFFRQLKPEHGWGCAPTGH